MATTIKLKNGSGAPLASDLVQGEPALDLTNKRLYSEDSGGTVIEIGTNPSTLSIAGTAVTATAAELNILDGVTATTAELNILGGVTAFVDEDDMSSNSATSIPSQQSVKAYVDSQVGSVDTLAELADTNVTTPADGALLFYDTTTSKWIDNVVSGDITIADTGVAAIEAGVIVNADVNASAAIDVSKTALTAGTGLTLTTNTLSVDAAQTQITSVGTLSSLSVSGTLTLGGTDITSTAAELNILDGKAFLDEDDMVSNSATGIPSQQSVKAYVDSQVSSADTLAELTDTNITTPADGALLFYDTGTSTWIDNVVSGDVTIADTGVAAIGSGVIVNDDINASAAISVSKTALVDGTGLTLTGDTLSVDASQTQITAVGTIATGTWQGTAIADAYVADNLTISGGTVDNSVIGGTTAAAGTFTDLTASGTLTLGGTAVTATAAELNYVDGVTSNIQTQLDSKVGASYTGDVDITGELLVDSYNETFKKVSSVGTSVGYNLSGANYDSKSFDISTQAGGVNAIRMKPDGTVLFVLNFTDDTIYQYSLSTPYDITTASYDSKSFAVTSQDASPRGLEVKPDGTKLYIAGDANNTVYEYDLSTAWDISTASYSSNSFSVNSQISSTAFGAVSFKSDGTSFYALGQNAGVYQYDLSTAWDVSSASYASKTLTTSSQDSAMLDMEFSTDGTKVFVSGNTNDSVYQYNLSTAWDLSTGSYSSISFSVTSQDTSPNGIAFSDSGTKMYIAGSDTDAVYQYSTSTTTYSTTFDCENANVFETELDANTTVVFSNPPASGTPVPSTSYDIAQATVVTTLDILSEENQVQALFVKPDGTSMYIVGSGSSQTVYQYDLTTAFDLSTASYASKSFSVNTQEPAASGLFFKSDGTKMYVVGANQDSVFQYSLSTAWDVSTASYDSVSFSVSSQDTSPGDLTFSSDGTKMYIAGRTNDSIYQYTLSTAWDLSTASYASKSLSVASQDTDPVALVFNNDGTELFVSGSSSDDIFKYTLTTAYDVSTASYASVSFAPATTNNMGIQFGDSGEKMYIANEGTDVITEYTVYQTSLNDSTAYAMSLKVVQDSGASGYTVTWPASVDWPAATAPTLTATASAVDQFVFYTYDGGTTWYGFTAGQALG